MNPKSYSIKCLLLCFSLICFHVALSADADETLWDAKLEAYFLKSKIPYFTQLRFYTYLYAAHTDGATCPRAVQNAITELLIERFFPDFTDFPHFESDSHSENLAEDILCPYLARISLEDASPQKFNSSCWLKKIPASVNQVAKWMPWISPLPQAPSPIAQNDTHAWSLQMEALKQIRRSLTPEQKALVQRWAANYGKNYEWRQILMRYLHESQVPLGKFLLVRSILMKGLYDGQIAEMRAKYFFCVPRPYMMDTAFKPLIKALHTPSYPSGHAIEGAIFATLLSHFFPEDQNYWTELADEGSMTRLWAGVHFPEDIQQGQLLGLEIALLILKNLCQNPTETSEKCPAPAL